MNDDTVQKLQHFFPREQFSTQAVAEAVEKGDILTDGSAILPFLQTALFDEKVLEVQLDDMDPIYFSRLKDDVPAPVDGFFDDGTPLPQPDYQEGTYLTEMAHIITLPLEPGLGNLHLRKSTRIVLRMFTSSYAIEMATAFLELTTIQDIPALRLAFPKLARIVHNLREFRAKVPDSLNILASLEIDEVSPPLDARPVNVSIRGISFAVSKAEQKGFKVNTLYSIKLFVEDELLIRIDGTVKHLSKIRKRSGIEYICGVEYDFRTRTQSAVIESIVALVQRAHLKELAEKSHATGISLIT